MTEDGRTREQGLFWLGSMFPISKEIGAGVEYALKKGWPVRIHLEPPDCVAFYVKVPANVKPPADWLVTADERGRIVHRRG